MLEGMKFAIGPTIAARRGVLTDLGGFDVLQAYLAEDFVMGKLAAERGHGVVLSSFVIEHHIGSTPFHANASHRLRWCRSTRRSRPAGYAGQVFTNPTPLALGLLCLAPGLWPLATVALLLRAMNAWAVAGWVLHDPLCSRRWWLIPLADLISFAFWVAGFFGSTIQWRGRKYLLLRDGRFEPTSGA
jgi:ceramide glucosyltransferase